MSTDPDDTADYPPPVSPILSAPPQPARIRDGEKALVHDHGDRIEEVDHDERAFLEMRRLFQTARYDNTAFNDVAYHHFAPGTRAYHERLKRQVKVKLEDDNLFDLMIEARSYLLRRDA